MQTITTFCRSCGNLLDAVLAQSGETLHPNCWCPHGERKGKNKCAVCRYESNDPELLDRLRSQGSVFGGGGKPTDAGVKIRSNASPTSIAAAIAALPKAGTQKNLILGLIRDAGASGLTDEQIASLGPLPLRDLWLHGGEEVDTGRIRELEFMQRVERLPRVRALTFDTRLEALMANAAGVVAMGGYNTFCEILSFDKKAIIVPRTRPRLEQFIRARAARNLGLIEMLDADLVQAFEEVIGGGVIGRIRRLTRGGLGHVRSFLGGSFPRAVMCAVPRLRFKPDTKAKRPRFCGGVVR